MEDRITAFFEEYRVAGTPLIAWLFGVGQSTVRDWAYDNDVPRVGNGFAFTEEIARDFAADLAGDEYDEDEDEGDDEESDDEEDDAGEEYDDYE